jgi:cell division protein FtsB
MNELGFTTEIYILIGFIIVPAVTQIVKEILAWRKGEDHNAIAELKQENRDMKAEMTDMRTHIYKLESENASLKGFIAGVSQNEEVKALFNQILTQSKQ